VSASLTAAVLEQIAATGVKVYGTPPPLATAYPYAVVYFDGGPHSSDREADWRIRRTHAWYTVTVGGTVSQTQAARERVVECMNDWFPTVDNRTVSKVEHDNTQPVRQDPALPDRLVFIATDQWQAVSDPT
jgi:hypothetical protein